MFPVGLLRARLEFTHPARALRGGESSRSNLCLANTIRSARRWRSQRPSRFLRPASRLPTTPARADSAVMATPTSVSRCAAARRQPLPGVRITPMAFLSASCRPHRRLHWPHLPLSSTRRARSLPAHPPIQRGVRATRTGSRIASSKRQERPRWRCGKPPKKEALEARKITSLRQGNLVDLKVTRRTRHTRRPGYRKNMRLL
jgi:hypothetical protein